MTNMQLDTSYEETESEDSNTESNEDPILWKMKGTCIHNLIPIRTSVKLMMTRRSSMKLSTIINQCFPRMEICGMPVQFVMKIRK